MSDHKAIFLDIDGVMINAWSQNQPRGQWFNKDMAPFSPDSVKALNQIITQNDARIIVTSGWRHDLTYDELMESFEFNKVHAHPHPLPFDFRGNFEVYENSRQMQRCKEIESYLRTYRPWGFLIIDDMHLPCFPNHQVNPSEAKGLTDEFIALANKIIQAPREFDD